MKNIKTFENFFLGEARYEKSYFKNPGVEADAEEEDLRSIKNDDLTGEGIIAKMKETQEEEGGVDADVYDQSKKDLESMGLEMPKDIKRK
jgi:hypothetical protein